MHRIHTDKVSTRVRILLASTTVVCILDRYDDDDVIGLRDPAAFTLEYAYY